MPSISVSGSGYAGSTWTVVDGGVGNWQVDASDGFGTGWADIAGANADSYVQTIEREGLPLRWRRADGVVSAPQHMWMPNDLPANLITETGARWLNFRREELITIVDGRVRAVPDLFGFSGFEQVNGNRAAPYNATRKAIQFAANQLREISSSTPIAFGFALFVVSNSGGTNTTFFGDEHLISTPEAPGRIHGTRTRAWLQGTAWATVVSKNGAALSSTVLPLNGDTLWAEGVKQTGIWSIGKDRGSDAQKHWQGPIWEALFLETKPDASDMERLLACVAHRAGTIGKLANNNPANPYLIMGPQAAIAVAPSPIAALSEVTLGTLTSLSSGKLQLGGMGAGKLVPLSSAATASLAITGQASGTLASLTASTVGVLPIQAQAGGMLASLHGYAAGTLAIVGHADAALAPLTGSAAAKGEQANTGRAMGQLSPVALSATGELDITGTADAMLDPLIATAMGFVVVNFDAPPRATVIVPSQQFATVVPTRQFATVVPTRQFAAVVPARIFTAEVQA